MKKKIIWSNIDLDINDWKYAYEEFIEANDIDEDPNDEDEIYKYMIDTNNMYLDDERANLNVNTDGRILIIADLGLWNGRVPGYKILNGNVSNILYADADYVEWYSDGHNIKATAYHHDGTNYYEYRVIREDKNIQNLLDAIYTGKEISRRTLNYYTKSLAPYVNSVYGW